MSRLIVCMAVLFVVTVSCSKRSRVANNGVAQSVAENADGEVIQLGEPIRAEELMEEHISILFAIYYLRPDQADVIPEFDKLLDEFPDLTKVEEIKPSEPNACVSAKFIRDVQENFVPQDLQSLSYFGHGLTDEQAQALQESTTALLLHFGHSKGQVWTGLQAAHKLTHAMAEATGGLIWDEETRETFTPAAWHEERIGVWTEKVPDVSKQTVIHAYRDGQLLRSITLGMGKFGLPDVVVNQFSQASSRNIGHTMNLFAQAMAEGQRPVRDGEFDLKLQSIENDKVREPQVEELYGKATGTARLGLHVGTHDEGDPHNRLIEITFERYEGNDNSSRQSAMLTDFFGSEDNIQYVKHSDAVLVASQRAKAKLSALRKDFTDGLKPGGNIQLKAPFETPEGREEWMWVEVTAWNADGRIKGILNNDPFSIPDLQAGQIVHIKEGEVFDYIRTFPDGQQEGNETGELMRQSSQ